VLKYLKVFCLGFLIDIMYVIWILAVASGSVWLASFASVGMAIPGIFGYMAILEDRKMAVPYLLGLFFGTMCGTVLHGYFAATTLL
jgi:hypothetical protein